jgi:hypothetical protein
MRTRLGLVSDVIAMPSTVIKNLGHPSLPDDQFRVFSPLPSTGYSPTVMPPSPASVARLRLRGKATHSDSRAITAPKSEAFSPPTALLDLQAFTSGSNTLSAAEFAFAKAYTDLGRPDLADCVSNPTGRLHQRLRAMIGFVPSFGMVKGLEGVLRDMGHRHWSDIGSSEAVGVSQTLEEWCARRSLT